MVKSPNQTTTAGFSRSEPTRPRLPLLQRSLPFVLVVCSLTPTLAGETPEPSFKADVAPFIARYCASCHGAEKQRGGLDFSKYGSAESVLKEPEAWEKFVRVLVEKEMPPRRKPQPSELERQVAVEVIEAELASFVCDDKVDPGAVTLRRLNRAEYDNTVRDIFGVAIRPSRNFPEDDVGYGFDNIGDVLGLPVLLAEKYLDAASEVVAAALEKEDELFFYRRFEAELLRADVSIEPVGDWAVRILREGGVYTSCDVRATSDYVVRIRAYGEQAGPELPRLEVRLGDALFGKLSVDVTEGAAAVYELRGEIPAGRHRLSVNFANNFNTDGDRNLVVDWFEVERLPSAETEGYAYRVFTCDPNRPGSPESDAATKENCARSIIARLGRRLYRRPLSDVEVETTLDLYHESVAAGDEFREAVILCLEAMLISPNFLYLVEVTPHRTMDPAPSGASTQPHVDLGDYALATRLAYFLWSSTPDDELLTLAEKGRLSETDTLEAQLRRMLAHPRSQALAENFAGQWLQTRLLNAVVPDPDLFPDFDAELKEAMAAETILYFDTLLREDRTLLQLIDSDFTILNERLAKHYGIAGVAGAEYRPVKLADSVRGGVLTQASVLTLTSNPTRTSPVKRGKWILEQVLGAPPPPPPPDVEELSEEPEAILSGSLRERLEKHRADPTCANCHQEMDVLGFAFENFDAVGSWREFDGKFLIDASGTLPDGRQISGPAQLKRLLLEDREAFTRTLSEKILTYALGRGLEYYDRCAVDEIVRKTVAADFRIHSWILAVVESDPFRRRRALQQETK